VGEGCRKDIEAALPVLLRHRKPLMLHAEIVSNGLAGTCDENCDVRKHGSWMDTRPPQFEVDAANAIVAALRNVRASHADLWANATTWTSPTRLGVVPEGFKVHIAHLGAADALPIYQQVCSLLMFDWATRMAMQMLPTPFTCARGRPHK
jgi:hypothetical protein